MARLAALVFLLVLLTGSLHAQPGQSRPLLPQHIDAYAREALKQWDIPGLALALVHDGKVVYLKGYGVKELGKPEAMTPDTVFPIASCTKAFTSLAVALMIQDGKM